VAEQAVPEALLLALLLADALAQLRPFQAPVAESGDRTERGIAADARPELHVPRLL